MEVSTSTGTTTSNVEVVNQADCYFYYYSSCNKGKACPFRHEPSALRNETMCVYWLKGNCNKPQCFYRHMEINKPRDKIPCFFESQPGGCKKLHCPFLHNNVLDQPREEDVAKNSDIILPVKDSEAEYQSEESDKKKLNANISAQIRLQRQMFECEDTSDIPSPPVVLRQPIIVPLHDGESDSESLYCPSPNKYAVNVTSTMDPETDWELERLKQIQVEEGNILGYPHLADEVANNGRQAIVTSSASSDSYETEVYISEEEVIEEHEMEEDVKDAVHRRLQFSVRNSMTHPSNFKVSISNNYKLQSSESTHNEPIRLQRKVLSGISSARIEQRHKDLSSQSSDDEEAISSSTPMTVFKRTEDSIIVSNRHDHVKKPLSVKERLGFKNNLEKVQDVKLGGLAKRRAGTGHEEYRLDRPNIESSRNPDKKIRIGLSKSSIQDGPLRHLGLDNNSVISKGIKEMRLGLKSDFHSYGFTGVDSNINDSRRKIDSKLQTKQLSLSNLKTVKDSRLIMNSRESLNVATPANKVRLAKDKPDFKMTSVNSNVNANLIIKSLADIKADWKLTSNLSLKREKNLSNLIYVPLSAVINDKSVSADSLKSTTDVGAIKIKTLAQIKAEKGISTRVKLDKPSRRPISLIRFDSSPEKVVPNRVKFDKPSKQSISPIRFDSSPEKVILDKPIKQPISPIRFDSNQEKVILNKPTKRPISSIRFDSSPEKGISNRVKLDKPTKRPISPIHFDSSQFKKHKPNVANFMTTSVKVVKDSSSNSSFKPIAKTVVNDALVVGSRKLTLKTTPPKISVANVDKTLTIKNEIKVNSCILNSLKEVENSVSKTDKRLTQNITSLNIENKSDSSSEQTKFVISKDITNNELHSSIENFTPEILSPSFEGDPEEKVISNGSKPLLKLNVSNNDIKEVHRRLSVGMTNKSFHRLDSFLDEDELLGEDLDDSFGEDEEINEEELLL